jgi:hypothetical protein
LVARLSSLSEYPSSESPKEDVHGN